jgi:hypothetical protein
VAEARLAHWLQVNVFPRQIQRLTDTQAGVEHQQRGIV